MPELIISIPLTLLIILASHEAGRLILRAFVKNNPLDNPLDNALLRVAIGYIGVEFILSILGHINLFRPTFFWILLIVLIASAIVFGRKSIADTCSGFRVSWVESRSLPLNNILAIVVLIALAMDFILTCVPTTAWDSLTYHYPLPAIWLGAGGFIPRLDICYSELPCASEMLFAFAFGLGGINESNIGAGHLAANHLTWITGVFACIAFVSISRRLGPSPAPDGKNQIWNSWTPGLIAAVAFLSLPIVYVEEMEGGYIENFLVFLSVVMLITLLHFRDTKNPGLITFIGIIAGGLLASKHTSLFINVVILLALIIWIVSSKKTKLWGSLTGAILLAILIPLPWDIKSFIHTGDPAWPFVSLLGNFDPSLPDIMYWSNPNVERSLWGFITYIYHLTWDESLTQFKFRLLSWYFLPLLPFVLWWSDRKENGRIIGFVTWILILLIYLLAPGEPRYMLVAWGLYAALGAWGLLSVLNRFPWITRLILPILLIIPIGLSLIDRTGEIKHRVPTIIGMATVDEYFEKSLDCWSLVKYINEETDPESKIILVEPRNFYIERDFIIWYPFPTHETYMWIRYTENELYQEWLDIGAEYVLVTYGPNYRALGIAKAFPRDISEHWYSNPLFPELPDWVFKRASYAERGLSLDEEGMPFLNGLNRGRHFGEFDISSVYRLERMYGYGYLEPVLIDDRTGTLFKVIYPEEVEE